MPPRSGARTLPRIEDPAPHLSVPGPASTPRYPNRPPLPMAMPTPDQIHIFRVTPSFISVLDYTKGFGHTDLVTV